MANILQPSQIGGLVLCGGRSQRMGQSKAWLRIGSDTFLQRVVRTLSQVVAPVWVVAAPDQDLPELPTEVNLVRDEAEYLGPLGGLQTGLRALPPEIAAIYATACDVPLLRPEFVSRIVSELGDAEIAVVAEGEFRHPLAAVYRRSVLPHVEELIREQRLRPVFLFERVSTRVIPVESLRAVDPDLHSLRNANTPEEYAELLKFTENK